MVRVHQFDEHLVLAGRHSGQVDRIDITRIRPQPRHVVDVYMEMPDTRSTPTTCTVTEATAPEPASCSHASAPASGMTLLMTARATVIRFAVSSLSSSSTRWQYSTALGTSLRSSRMARSTSFDRLGDY
jgi:hypothetical protein